MENIKPLKSLWFPYNVFCWLLVSKVVILLMKILFNKEKKPGGLMGRGCFNKPTACCQFAQKISKQNKVQELLLTNLLGPQLKNWVWQIQRIQSRICVWVQRLASKSKGCPLHPCPHLPISSRVVLPRSSYVVSLCSAHSFYVVSTAVGRA